jgi:hypothetical protein
MTHKQTNAMWLARWRGLRSSGLKMTEYRIDTLKRSEAHMVIKHIRAYEGISSELRFR